MSDEAALILRLEARTKKFEKDLAKAIDKLDGNVKRGNRAFDKGFTRMERRAQKFGKSLTRSMERSTSRVNALLASVGLALSVRQVSRYADAWTAAGNKVGAAEVVFGKQLATLEEINGLANETRQEFDAVTDLYSRLARSAATLDVEQQQVLRTTELLAKALKAGGASATEQYSAILQLTQGIASGALQGDELRTVRESAPLIAKAIADEFGVAIGELKALGAEGQITADVIFAAVERGAKDIEAQFAATTPTIGEAFTILRNNVIEFIGSVDDGTGASARLSSAIIDFAEALPRHVDATLDALEDIGDGIKVVTDLWDKMTQSEEEALAALPSAGTDLLEKDLADFIQRREELLAKMNDGVPNTKFLDGQLQAELDKLNRYIDVTVDKIKEVKAALYEGDPNADMRDLLSDLDVEAEQEEEKRPPRGVTTKPDKALERQLEAIRKLGLTEREQIQELLEMRLAAIDKAKISEDEKNKLRVNAHQDALNEVAELEQEEAKAEARRQEDLQRARDQEFIFNQDRLSFLAEIDAAKARMAGRASEAVRIELEAVKARYQAELDYIDDLIQKKGMTPELMAQRADAEAGIASTDAALTLNRRSDLESFDALTDDRSALQAELDRIDEIERAKMERLEELRTEELEALRDFEAEKTAIEKEAEDQRREAKFAALKSNLDLTKGMLSDITSALAASGREGTKAAKIAAKAQQAISLANAVINTAEGVSEALSMGNIPKAILIGSLGAVQIGAIAAQTFDGGGPTKRGPRAGGLDGKGGYWAIVHPNEVVADMTKPGREVGGKSLQEAFGLSGSLVSRGRSMSSRGLSGAGRMGGYSYTSGDFIVQGDVTRDALPELEAALKEFRDNQERDFERMFINREKRTLSRTERRVGRRQ